MGGGTVVADRTDVERHALPRERAQKRMCVTLDGKKPTEVNGSLTPTDLDPDRQRGAAVDRCVTVTSVLRVHRRDNPGAQFSAPRHLVCGWTEPRSRHRRYGFIWVAAQSLQTGPT